MMFLNNDRYLIFAFWYHTMSKYQKLHKKDMKQKEAYRKTGERYVSNH